MDLSERVGVVTGGASGIGRAVAATMAQRKVKAVALVDQNAAVHEVARSLNQEAGREFAMPFEGDTTDEAFRASVFDTISKAHGLVSLCVPAAGITRYQCGTQPILSLTALDCGLDTLLAAEAQGGMGALRRKSLALTGLFMQLVRTRLHGQGFGIATPELESLRGSQVSLTRQEGAYAIVQALIARGVIGDFRAGDGGHHPDILRFGFTPLYIGYADVWHAVEHLRQVMTSGEWRDARFAHKNAVT
ncbi:MAG: Kynureninase [Pseudomonadota bacterium]